MLIEKQNMRFERLKLFLAPYPYFRVNLKRDLDKPISFREKNSKLEFELSPIILHPKAPSWIESKILSCALTVKRTGDVCQLTYKELEAHFKQELESKTVDQKLELKELWFKIRKEYFPQRTDIDNYKVSWSRRKHTSCLASCNYRSKKVIVAEALSVDEYYEYLEPLLYHEMCHAIIGEPDVVRGRRVLHGRAFKALERRHPDIPKLDAWIKRGGWTKAVREWERR